jgi:hypothetical protein
MEGRRGDGGGGVGADGPGAADALPTARAEGHGVLHGRPEAGRQGAAEMTGRRPGWNLRKNVLLECSKCGRTQEALSDPTDPPRTAKVRCVCDRCDDGDHSLIDYFDAAGRHIDLEGRPMA